MLSKAKLGWTPSSLHVILFKIRDGRKINDTKNTCMPVQMSIVLALHIVGGKRGDDGIPWRQPLQYLTYCCKGPPFNANMPKIFP